MHALYDKESHVEHLGYVEMSVKTQDRCRTEWYLVDTRLSVIR